MEHDEAEKIAKRTFKPSSIERAWDHFAANAPTNLLVSWVCEFINYMRLGTCV